MQQRKVWKLYRLLSPKERKHFAAWLELELEHRQQAMLTLFKALQMEDEAPGYVADPRDKLATERRIWHQIYPEEVFNYPQFRRLCEQLVQWQEDYLAIKAFRRDQSAKELYMVRELNRRDPEHLFINSYRKVQKRLQQRKVRDAKYYQLQYLLESEYQQYAIHFSSDESQRREGQIQFAFDQWWLLTKIDKAIQHQFLHENQRPDSLFLEELRPLFSAIPQAHETPVLDLYFKLYATMTGTSRDIDNLIESLKLHEACFSKDSLINFYLMVLNYLIRQRRSTQDRYYLEKLYELYQWALERRLIFVNQTLPRQHYKNLITFALNLANTSPAEERALRLQQAYEYLHSLRQHLPEAEREDAYHFNMALYHFAAGSYDKVESSQGGRPFSDINFAIQGRLVSLRARYEMKDSTYLSNSIRSLKRYIQNQPRELIPDRTAYLTHLRFFRRLVLCYTPAEFLKLKKALVKTPRLYEKNWLLSKVEEGLDKGSPFMN